VIDLFGVSIHDPDVVFTDLGLALLGAYFGWRLWGHGGALARMGAVLMGGLASAAFWGAVFHAFFPAGTATTPGFIAWIPVSLSIVVAAATMLGLALLILVPGLPARGLRGIVAAYDGVLVAAAAALGVPTSLAELPDGLDHEAERLRIEHELQRAGLSWQATQSQKPPQAEAE